MTRILCGEDEMMQAHPDGDMKIPFGEVNESHLEMAKANLLTFDVVGMSDELDAFLHSLRALYGWRIPLTYKNMNSQGRLSKEDYPLELNRTIEKHNQLDMELYKWASERGGQW